MSKRTKLWGIILTSFFFAVCFYIANTVSQKQLTALAATNTSMSITLSNPRLSFRSGVSAAVALGNNSVNIITNMTGSSQPDLNLNNLFPGETICFNDGSNNYRGCRGSVNPLSVLRISGNGFTFNPILDSAIDTTDLVVASQSGQMTINIISTGATIPVNSRLTITIPAHKGTGGTGISFDGIPDTANVGASNGFDMNNIPGTSGTSISISNGTGCTWDSAIGLTPGNGSSTDHTIQFWQTGSGCQFGSVNITIGTTAGTSALVNPAPLISDHTQGLADVYSINASLVDPGSAPIFNIDSKVAPIEGVFVSATIDETLSFQVSGIVSSSAACGGTTDVTTTATSVPWGTITSYDTFKNAAQRLAVSTNAKNGYSVVIDENDQLGKEGNVCIGNTAGESSSCIQDTFCGTIGTGTTCSEYTEASWGSGSTAGFGISLENVAGGSVATWMYNKASGNCDGTFCARQIADMEAAETARSIMGSTAPSNANQINVCYRIAITNTQAAGYYYNRVRYTAVATF